MKKLRLLFWLISAFARKHSKTVITTGFATFFLVLFGWRFSDQVRAIIFPDRTYLGVVGLYTPATLPRFIQEKVSVGLTQLTTRQEVVPAAASSWRIKDAGKTYIFKVRNDLLWHDGKQLKANDVNYNFKDAQISPINQEVLKITLKEPFSALPSLLSKPLFREGFIGLGPYKVARIEWNGQFIRKLKLEPLDPSVDIPETIIFYPTLSQAVTAFKLGEINSLRTVEASSQLLSWNNYLDIKETENPSQYITILFNTKKPPFDQKQFRQALAYSIPNKTTHGNLKGPIAKNSWAYNSGLKEMQFNREKALELLEKSGVATQSAQFTIHTFPNLLEVASELRNAWEKLGLKANIKVVNTVSQDYSVLLSVQEIPRDPDQYPLWHSIQSETNITNYRNPKIDKLLEDGRKTFDIQKRKEIYDDFQRYIMDELPAIFLYHPTIYTISRK
jgi:peptide/nickel transport system substrate-binding protein